MAEQPTNPPEIPSHEDLDAELGQYKVLECVGVGGMGGVYKAHQENLDRHVAVKVLARGFSTDEFSEHFQSEAQAMARLNQTNIISVYDFGHTSSGWLYFVMEFVDGKTLFDLLHENLIDRAAAVATIVQVCGALKYAHEHGVVHRDIKSANILVDSHGHAKVGDFGLAKLYADGGGTKGLGDSSYGTPDYAAPEVIDPNATIDHRADIYSVGALFFELLSGSTPNPGTKPLTHTPFDPIIQKAMAADPKDRYQSASELRQVIEETWSAASSGGGTGLGKEGAKSAGNKILAAVAAVAVLGAVLAMILKGGDKDPNEKKTAKTSEQPKSNPEPQNPGPGPGPAVTSGGNGKKGKGGGKGDENLSSIFEGGVIKEPPPKDPDPVPDPLPVVKNDNDPNGEPKMPPIEVVPKEPTEAEKKIQPILDSFYPRFESSVVTQYNNKVETLRANYLGALKPIEEKMKEMGNPQGVIELRAEMERLQTGKPIPEDTTGVSDLDGMRRKYLGTLAEYSSERDSKADRLLIGLNGLLEELESDLTREAELDTAVGVREYRTNLKEHIMHHFFPEEYGKVESSSTDNGASSPSTAQGNAAILIGQVWKRNKDPQFLLEIMDDGTVRYKAPDGSSDPWEQGEPKWRKTGENISIHFKGKAYPVGGGKIVIEDISDSSIKLRNPNRRLGGMYTGIYEKL